MEKGEKKLTEKELEELMKNDINKINKESERIEEEYKKGYPAYMEKKEGGNE